MTGRCRRHACTRPIRSGAHVWETRGRFFSPTCVGPTRPFYSASPSPFHFTVFTFSSPSASGSSAFRALLPFPLSRSMRPVAGSAAGPASQRREARREARRGQRGRRREGRREPRRGGRRVQRREPVRLRRGAAGSGGSGGGGGGARHQRRPLPRSIFNFFICIQFFLKNNAEFFLFWMYIFLFLPF